MVWQNERLEPTPLFPLSQMSGLLGRYVEPRDSLQKTNVRGSVGQSGVSNLDGPFTFQVSRTHQPKPTVLMINHHPFLV